MGPCLVQHEVLALRSRRLYLRPCVDDTRKISDQSRVWLSATFTDFRLETVTSEPNMTQAQRSGTDSRHEIWISVWKWTHMHPFLNFQVCPVWRRCLSMQLESFRTSTTPFTEASGQWTHHFFISSVALSQLKQGMLPVVSRVLVQVWAGFGAVPGLGWGWSGSSRRSPALLQLEEGPGHACYTVRITLHLLWCTDRVIKHW